MSRQGTMSRRPVNRKHQIISNVYSQGNVSK